MAHYYARAQRVRNHHYPLDVISVSVQEVNSWLSPQGHYAWRGLRCPKCHSAQQRLY